jgi:hypothetical protein
MRKNEFPKNDAIVLGFSCYTREKGPRRLSGFFNQVWWEGKEIFSFPLLTTLLNSAQFQGIDLFFNSFPYCLTSFWLLPFLRYSYSASTD